jgi:hypothetical protein
MTKTTDLAALLASTAMQANAETMQTLLGTPRVAAAPAVRSFNPMTAEEIKAHDEAKARCTAIWVANYHVDRD